MKIRIVSLAVVLAISVAMPVHAEQGGVDITNAAWAAAMKANDIEAVVACYASDAVAWFPNSPELRGEKAIREAWAWFLGENTVKDVKFLEGDHISMGDRSVGWGRFSMTVLPKGATEPVTESGRYTEVAELRDGRWVYTVDHASLDPVQEGQKQ